MEIGRHNAISHLKTNEAQHPQDLQPRHILKELTHPLQITPHQVETKPYRYLLSDHDSNNYRSSNHQAQAQGHSTGDDLPVLYAGRDAVEAVEGAFAESPQRRD